MKEAWKAVGITLLAVVVIAAIWWFSFGASVLSSKPIGQGEAIIEKNSAENWTKAQGRFEDMYAEIVATDQKITVAKERMDTDPDDRTAKDTYYGTKTICLSFVADYNAEARKFLSADFRSADLPDQISDRQPSTDCQE